MKRVLGVLAIVIIVVALGIEPYHAGVAILLDVVVICILTVAVYKVLGFNASGPVKRIFARSTYSEQHGRYPPAKSMEELQKILVPKYLADLRVRDGWGRPWHFEMTPQDYRISSLGADNCPVGP